MKALITGFKPFGSYVQNPTEELCRRNNGKTIGNYSILSEVLDTRILEPYGESIHGKDIIERVIKENIHVILSFGMASEVHGLRIESKASNIIDNAKYALPHEHGKEVISGREGDLQIDLSHRNIPHIQDAIRSKGLPFETEISTDAGKFCCNALIYSVLHEMQERHVNIPFLFLHCSCTQEAVASVLDFSPQKTIITDENLDSYLNTILLSI